LWIYVSNEQKNPLTEREISVALEVAGLSSDYQITEGLPERIGVKVQGYSSTLAALNPADFSAQIIIPAERTGFVTMPVLVNAPPGVQCQVYPNEVSVTIETMSEKVVPVVVNLKGQAATGFVTQAPQSHPVTVTAKGPKQAINDLSQIRVEVDIEAAKQRIEQTLNLVTNTPGVHLSHETVWIIVPVIQTDMTKTVPVNPQIVGTPAMGYQVIHVVADPAEVEISGQPDVVTDIQELLTRSVNIQDADKNHMEEVSLQPVSGVDNLESQLIMVQVLIGLDETSQELPSQDPEEI
jgi:YbbR domain-containing protein